MSIQSLIDCDIASKRVLIRVDFNVPLDQQGRIAHDSRMQAVLPTIEYALKHDAAIILMSHFGRPVEGEFDPKFSLKKICEHLAHLLKREVHFISNFEKENEFKRGEVYLLENVRFLSGEKENSLELGQQLASLCDVFVMDAFSVAHRSQASTHRVAQCAPVACAGLALGKELQALSKALAKPEHPLVAIVGGSKVSTKFQVLDSLLDMVDTLILGGGMANTFLKAQGVDIGSSLYEASWCDKALLLIAKAKRLNKNLILPIDVICAKEITQKAVTSIRALTQILEDDMILDLGPQSIQIMKPYLLKAKTIVWNGPVGVFEMMPFENGTRAIGECVAQSAAFSMAGGGDTLAAIDQFDLANHISYQSNAGGAFLEYLEGKVLPGLEVLKQEVQQV